MSKCRCKLWELEGYTFIKEYLYTASVTFNIHDKFASSEEEILDIYDLSANDFKCIKCDREISRPRRKLIEEYACILRCKTREKLVSYLFSSSKEERKLVSYLLKYNLGR